MVAPAHLRVTFSGVFGPPSAPVEQWAWGVSLARFARVDGDTTVTNPTQLQGLADLGRLAYAQQLAFLFRPNVTLTRVRCASVLETGHVEQDAQGGYVQRDSIVEVPGTASSGPNMPLQVALCVSLMTGRAGSTGRGRLFLPWPAFGVGDDFRLAAADAATIATRVRAVIKAMKPATGDWEGPIVASSKGYLTGVNGIRVGTTPDTMRSRRESLPEAYQVLPYPG